MGQIHEGTSVLSKFTELKKSVNNDRGHHYTISPFPTNIIIQIGYDDEDKLLVDSRYVGPNLIDLIHHFNGKNAYIDEYKSSFADFLGELYKSLPMNLRNNDGVNYYVSHMYSFDEKEYNSNGNWWYVKRIINIKVKR